MEPAFGSAAFDETDGGSGGAETVGWRLPAAPSTSRTWWSVP
ncbi:hypothetical protein [Halopiger aswanensis]|nr:hypothetical protein [Halopiger aswanensis]